MKKTFRTAAISTLLFALAAAAATACGSSSSGGTSQNMAVMSGAAATETMSETAVADMYMEANGTWGESGLAAGGWENGTGAVSSESGSDSGNAPSGENAPDSAQTGRKLIRTVDLNVETTKFDPLLASIEEYVTGIGGYIEQSEISGTSISVSDGHRHAYITVRVPAEHLNDLLTQMDEQSNVTHRSENVQDITLQYADIEGRKKTLTIEQERLWELLEKADSIDTVIALEERLSEIRYELEKFESQLRTYDDQVEYSTVYISIDEVAVFTPTEPDSILIRIQKGFSRNLQNVGNSFVNFFVWFISSLPTLIVWAVLAAAVFLIARAVIRRRPRKAGKKPKKTDGQETPGSPSGTTDSE